MSINIEVVHETDFLDIAAIYQFYVENTLATFEIKAPHAKELIERWQRHIEMPFIVARLREEVVGFAYVRPYHQRCAYKSTVEDSVYVHPQHTQKGIGARLLENLLKACQDKTIKEIIARIAIWENSASSINLHKKFGFQEKGCLTNVGFKFNRFVDTVLLQKSIYPS
ncbi:MAG: N-acetyltransferase family protein [Pseudomonadota bacterium]